MNLSTDQDVSLYDCALSAIAPPHPLQVSYPSFKGMVGGVFDLLIEQKIPATLWVKLPDWCDWQVDLDRYRHLLGGTNPVYILNPRPDEETEKIRDEKIETAGGTGGTKELYSRQRYSFFKQRSPDKQNHGDRHLHRHNPPYSAPLTCGIDENSLISDEGTIFMPTKTPLPLCSIQLVLNSKLNDEYFLIVLSPELSVAILASPGPSKGVESHSHQESRRNKTLVALYSIDQQTIQKVFDGLKVSVSKGRCQSCPISEKNQPPIETDGQVCENLLENWDMAFGHLELPKPDPLLLGHLFSKQLQRLEQQGQELTGKGELAALRRQNQELLNALQFKDEFLNKIGQELRTPLTNMKTALSLLDSPKIKPAQRDRYSTLLHLSCDRQNALIEGFLELVRLESEVDKAKMEGIRLGELVPGIVSIYQPIAQEKGVLLAYTLRSTLPPVICTREWLKKIVINLLQNAIKFTGSGGEVWVRSKQQGDYVQLEFRDTGIGIPPGEIPKVFEAFYRGRQAINDDIEGAGLGLTIVQQLLLHSGGSITVKSRVGRGSVFTLLLPVYDESQEEW
ncbi:histidine kinase [Phormidium pseudopriestleyi FRX01]|uniref:histidine kinase n=1 Tax=Phormidium pseudopriestleyi FRX01 TaxID=1759528 RepID=A0ABS3FKE1_9CYAN|nr:ATP-binding protein [Phormidium pseudopriestleyi]MBO0347571.1 histidine kinase [Phormidium pseudopriestleyi FRX01]